MIISYIPICTGHRYRFIFLLMLVHCADYVVTLNLLSSDDGSVAEISRVLFVNSYQNFLLIIVQIL